MISDRRTFVPFDWKESYRIIQRLEKRCVFALDVGCGDGEKTLYHMKLLEKVIGVDISLKALQIAKSRGIPTVQTEATKLPFRSNCFDFVTSFHVLEHVREGLAFVNEIHRVLRRKGNAIIITPNRLRINAIVLNVLNRNTSGYPRNPDHVFEYAKTDLASLAKKSNFKTYNIYPIGWIRLHFLQVSFGPRFFRRYSDQFMLVLKK